jgi:hypothetical protein
MRRGSKPEFIYDKTRPSTWPKDGVKPEGDKGLLLGVNLSADFCAEHEWGIKPLKTEFGIPDKLPIYGMKRRKVTVLPADLGWVEFNSTYFMGTREVKEGKAKKVGDKKLSNAGFVYHRWYNRKPADLALNMELHGVGLRGAWSEQDFAAVSSDSDDIEALREIFAEFSKMNIIIMLSGSGIPFGNPGLLIAIADRIPLLFVEQWYKHDKDQHKVTTEFAATGIEEILKDAGKRYFALSPRRQEDGSLRYWLNPYEQRVNNGGWYTLQDLLDWVKGEGPIPMKNKVTV